MLPAINFYRKICLTAVKIDYIFSYGALTIYFDRISFKETIPQTPLLFCHILTQGAGIIYICVLIFMIISTLFQTEQNPSACLRQAPPLIGEARLNFSIS